MARTAANPLADVIHAVSDDPEVKAAARQLALEAIGQAQYLLRNGNPTVKATMLRSILPTAFAGMKEQAEDPGASEARKVMDSILEDMRKTG